VDRRGQRIESFCIDVWDGSKWEDGWTSRQLSVHKRLLPLGFARHDWRRCVSASRARVLSRRWQTVGLFKQAELVQRPVISKRDGNGSVSYQQPEKVFSVVSR